MLRLSSPFDLDLRSIALFRVLLGSTMLYDIMARFPYVGLYLSDSGALSRADLLATVNRPWTFSIYMLVGEGIQVQAILIIHAIAALALVLGFRTRLASITCWVLLVSLQHRNPLMLNGGDTLFALYAFWAMFLPLNARWSLDRALAGETVSSDFRFKGNNRFHAIPGAAFILQTVFVYWFTVVLKSGDLWRNGEAISYVVRNLGLIESGALWFQQYERLQTIFTYLTFHWEWVGCILILSPFANQILRAIAIGIFVALHLGFGWMLDLALFPVISIAGWIALLPSSVWDSLERVRARIGVINYGRKVSDWVSTLDLKGGGAMVPGRPASVICGIGIVLVFSWNLRGLPNSPLNNAFPKPVSNLMYALKLRQKWSMFAANPPRYSGWYTIEAQMASGDTVDLFYPQVPYTLRRPVLFTDRYPDRRWGKFLDNLRNSKYRRLRDDYVEFLVNRWSEQRKSGSKIQTASLVYLREKIALDGSYADPEIRKLVTIQIDGITQVDSSANGMGETLDGPELADL